MKRLILLTILLSILAIVPTYGEEIQSYTETAIVLEVLDLDDQSQHVQLKITSGKYKEKIVETINHLSGNYIYDIPVKENDKVVVVIEEQNDTIEVFVSDYMRQNYAIYLGLLFVALILLIGRKKGLKAVITLTITLFTILKVLLPLILRGYHPVPITIAASVFITVITLFIIAGINSKSIAAILGTTGGVLTAGLLAYLIGSKVRLTGMSSEEAVMLTYIPQAIAFDFRGLLFSGIILGALGAVMDIGMSIASSIEEIHRVNPRLTQKELFASGMNVGQDVMGTMTNTLILAYTGSSIPLLLLFMAYETSFVKILNLDIIATEVIRSLAGSIGLVVAIPITALVSSFFIKKNKAENDKTQEDHS
ncbi:MAG: YibE/F family protein [Anaerosolibacter sp.]|jgi:uncharacterized membrane protein|uniref:YibE/F family protein n=1 Tax=Anaerosolibacter sp. TaxID=1872527 RepID=UPI00260DDD1E|nr:YibE/F family protein [Anaerosolibacter sp.]MDF2548577.1 YibE/F family protein [Anaerosolibacter sp.]